MKIIRVILWIFIALFFLLGLLWLINGSLEAFPTPEQVEKSRLTAILIIVSSCLSAALMFFTRKK